MAQSMNRVTKKDLVDMLKDYKDKDFVGVIFQAQDGKESPYRPTVQQHRI